MNIKKKLKNRRRIAIIIAILLICVCCIFGIEIAKYKKKNQQLQAIKERLDEKLYDQELRQELLDDEEAYVQTIQYIEEKAKSIGYVYPDEIIFKKAD